MSRFLVNQFNAVWNSVNAVNQFNAGLSGSIPGEVSLLSAAETRYVKLEMVEDAEAEDYDPKPLAVSRVQFYGCPLEESLADCGNHQTRIANNVTSYRHVGY